MMNLSSGELRDIVLALNIAIAHETEVISRLKSNDRFNSFTESIEDRRKQIAKFKKLVEKLGQQ